MVIKIEIYTLSMSFDPVRWQEEYDAINKRVSEWIKEMVLHGNAGAIGAQTFLDEETGYVVARVTVDRGG